MPSQSELIPTWTMRGICTETRELKSKSSGEVWNHAVKLTAMGGVFELSTKSPEVFASIAEGMEYRATGTFDFYNGKAQFIIREIEEVTA